MGLHGGMGQWPGNWGHRAEVERKVIFVEKCWKIEFIVEFTQKSKDYLQMHQWVKSLKMELENVHFMDVFA